MFEAFHYQNYLLSVKNVIF